MSSGASAHHRSQNAAVDRGSEETCRVNVAVRLRPPDSAQEDVKDLFTVDQTRIKVHDPLSRGRGEQTFAVTRVFQPKDGQEVVFESVARPLVDQVVRGYNSCCFAYGQTGSGKTYSVFGEGTAENRGMLSRSIEYLFAKIEALQRQDTRVTLAVSFLEIYLDQVRDLGRFYTARRGAQEEEQEGSPGRRHSVTSPPSRSAGHVAPGQPGQRASPSRRASLAVPGGRPRTSLKQRRPSEAFADPAGLERQSSTDSVDPYLAQDLAIHETPQGVVYVEDLSSIPVTGIQEVLDIANLGVSMQARYETKLNAQSSRSHTIFTVSVLQKPPRRSGGAEAEAAPAVRSMINFVDLAGSERLARSQAEGKRFQEAVVINSSLSTLGKVVRALGSGSVKHVPYRDSKLTRILQNSLGGNSYTTLLTTINPAADNYQESLNSLMFADRCKDVMNRPSLNEVQDQETHRRIIKSLLAEIAQLKQQLNTMAPPRIFITGEGGEDQHEPGHAEEAVSPMDEAGKSVAAAAESPTAQQKRLGGGRLSTESEKAMMQEVEALESAQDEEVKREQRRKREVVELRQQNRDLEIEIAKCRCKIAHLTGKANRQNSELEMLHGNMEKVLRTKEEQLQQLRPAISGRSESVEAAVAAKRIASQAQRLAHNLTSVQGGHEQERAFLERQFSQWIAEREAEGAQVAAEIEKCKAAEQRWRQVIAGDLISVHDLAKQLGQIVESLSAGVPEHVKTGIRPLGLPKPELAKVGEDCHMPDTFLQQLRREMAEVRRQVQHSAKERGSSRSTTGQGAGGTRASSKGSTARARPNTGQSPTADAVSNMPWDPDGFARDFCFSNSGETPAASWADAEKLPAARAAGSKAPAPLARLTSEQLRLLCAALLRRAHMTESEQKVERDQLQEEVVDELVSSNRLEEIRSIEQEILQCKSKLQHEEEQARLLETSLQACLRAAASRPASAPSSSRPVSVGPKVRR